IENVTVRDLHVVRTKGAGIKGHSTPSSPANRRSLIQSCVVDDTDGEGIALIATDQSIVANCFVSRTGKHGIISTQGNENTVRGNTITRATANGIQAAGLSPLVRASSLVIEGNLCYANGESGIYLKAVDNFVVEGNACFDNGTSATEKDGIRLEGVWDGIVLGNRCYDDQAAKTQAHGLGIVGGATNVLVAMNDLSGNAVGAIGNANLFSGTS